MSSIIVMTAQYYWEHCLLIIIMSCHRDYENTSVCADISQQSRHLTVVYSSTNLDYGDMSSEREHSDTTNTPILSRHVTLYINYHYNHSVFLCWTNLITASQYISEMSSAMERRDLSSNVLIKIPLCYNLIIRVMSTLFAVPIMSDTQVTIL